MFRKKILIILILPLFVLNCSITQKKGIQLLETTEDMQKEVRRHISIGLPVQDARKIVEDSEFSCRDIKNGSFVVDNRDRDGKLLSQTSVNGDFLECGITHSYFLASQGWGVYILYKNNKVIRVDANVSWQNL
jgi:hypothetical protein